MSFFSGTFDDTIYESRQQSSLQEQEAQAASFRLIWSISCQVDFKIILKNFQNFNESSSVSF